VRCLYIIYRLDFSNDRSTVRIVDVFAVVVRNASYTNIRSGADGLGTASEGREFDSRGGPLEFFISFESEVNTTQPPSCASTSCSLSGFMTFFHKIPLIPFQHPPSR